MRARPALEFGYCWLMKRRGRAFQLGAAVLGTAALGWMAAPTYPMEWAIGPDELGPTTWHSWLDPLAFGYGLFPPVLFVASFFIVFASWIAFFRNRASLVGFVGAAVMAASIALLGLVVLMHAVFVVPITLLALSSVLSWSALRLERNPAPVEPEPSAFPA